MSFSAKHNQGGNSASIAGTKGYIYLPISFQNSSPSVIAQYTDYSGNDKKYMVSITRETVNSFYVVTSGTTDSYMSFSFLAFGK